MMVHEGPARVFECEEDACEAILSGKIKEGDVVVIRYEGPKGGPGMREMLNPTSEIAGMGLGSTVALITDGPFQRCVQRSFHRSRITGSSSRRSDRTGRRRRYHQDQHSGKQTGTGCFLMKSWQEEKPTGHRESQKVKTGYLARYASMVTSGNRGAILVFRKIILETRIEISNNSKKSKVEDSRMKLNGSEIVIEVPERAGRRHCFRLSGRHDFKCIRCII